MGTKKEDLSLEEMMQKMDLYIKQLESDEISLEDSFHLYEQGMKLLKECNDKIDKVEKKVLQLNADGSLQEL